MALSQIPNPYDIDWTDWIDTLVGFNAQIRADISPDQPWQEVADRLTQIEVYAPQAGAFTDWREWAAALKQAYPD